MDAHEGILSEHTKTNNRIRELEKIPSNERTTKQEQELRLLLAHLKELGEADDEKIFGDSD